MTEVNHKPSKYSAGKTWVEERQEFLSNPFFRSFPVVIMGAKGIVKTEQVEKVFGVKKETTVLLAHIGSASKRKLEAEVYRSEKQLILLVNQLSGGAGWSNEALQNLADIAKQALR